MPSSNRPALGAVVRRSRQPWLLHCPTRRAPGTCVESLAGRPTSGLGHRWASLASPSFVSRLVMKGHLPDERRSCSATLAHAPREVKAMQDRRTFLRQSITRLPLRDLLQPTVLETV